MKLPNSRRETAAHEAPEIGLVVHFVRHRGGGRRIPASHAKGPESNDPEKCRTSIAHERESLRTMSSARRGEAGPGTTSQTPGLFSMPCAAGIGDYMGVEERYTGSGWRT